MRVLVVCPPLLPPPNVYVICGNNVMSAQMLEVSLIGVGTVLRLENGVWSMVK